MAHVRKSKKMGLSRLFKKAVKGYAHLRIFLGNGKGIFEDFKYPLILAIGLKIYFPLATITQMIFIVAIMMIIFTFVGWFDLRYIKLAQTQAEISTGKYNPYFTKLKKSLNSSTS